MTLESTDSPHVMQSLLSPVLSEGEVQDPADEPMGKVVVSQSCTTSAYHVHITNRGVSKNSVQFCIYAASIKHKDSSIIWDGEHERKSVPAAVNPGWQQV